MSLVRIINYSNVQSKLLYVCVTRMERRLTGIDCFFITLPMKTKSIENNND